MKRLLFVLGMVLVISWTCLGQTNPTESPATKEDVARYLQIVQSREMAKKMATVMSQTVHHMLHEQYLNHKDELPTEYESKMTARMDEMFENMPWDEMLDAMAPAYQKHFTKGDIDNLIMFYSSPTGEKLLREMPSVMSESMGDVMPIMTKYMETVQQRLRKETDEMIAQSKKQPHASVPAANN